MTADKILVIDATVLSVISSRMSSTTYTQHKPKPGCYKLRSPKWDPG